MIWANVKYEKNKGNNSKKRNSYGSCRSTVHFSLRRSIYFRSAAHTFGEVLRTKVMFEKCTNQYNEKYERVN